MFNYHLILNFDKANRVAGNPLLTISERIICHAKIAGSKQLLDRKVLNKFKRIENLAKRKNYQPVLFQIDQKQKEVFVKRKRTYPATQKNAIKILKVL